ncbi:hypothetical protein HDV00_003937 [Rhizophlyctis rosea]|nr:hypothetical protein HDV00_003937 [Rhizophlyctis rosea]
MLVEFRWTEAAPGRVFLKGSFDNWTRGVEMRRSDDGNMTVSLDLTNVVITINGGGPTVSHLSEPAFKSLLSVPCLFSIHLNNLHVVDPDSEEKYLPSIRPAEPGIGRLRVVDIRTDTEPAKWLQMLAASGTEKTENVAITAVSQIVIQGERAEGAEKLVRAVKILLCESHCRLGVLKILSDAFSDRDFLKRAVRCPSLRELHVVFKTNFDVTWIKHPPPPHNLSPDPQPPGPPNEETPSKKPRAESQPPSTSAPAQEKITYPPDVGDKVVALFNTVHVMVEFEELVLVQNPRLDVRVDGMPEVGEGL